MAEAAEQAEVERGNGGDLATLDSLLPEVWPDGYERALDAWQQGHLLPGGTLSWAAPFGFDAVTGVEAEADESPLGESQAWCHVSVADFRCEWAIVTSQTCDIAAVGPGARHPLVQVSPVRLAPEISENQRAAIERYEVTHLVALSKPPSEGFWVADLRVSMPVSKNFLATNTPVSAFSSEEDSLNFAEHMAARLRRPSLHDAVSETMVRSIGQHIKTTNKGNPEWWEHVEQLRVLIIGPRLDPSSVQLVVVQQVKLTVEQKKVWRDWVTSFRRTLRKYGIEMSPIHFTTLDEMSARVYRESIPLRVSELRRAHIW